MLRGSSIFRLMTTRELYSIFQAHPHVCTDTRKLTKGSLFFALKGPNFDANRFANEALNKGAAFAVVSDPSLKGNRFIYVEDTLKALQDIALLHRSRFDIPVLAITGSNGKTTTKELILAVLAEKYRVEGTKGNLNNHIGVPLTLLAIPEETELAVIEMGANHEGEIRFLCDLAKPTHGLISNIGKAHLEGFGSIEGIIRAKSELYQYLGLQNGVVFVNLNEDYLPALSENMTYRYTYKFDSRLEIHAWGMSAVFDRGQTENIEIKGSTGDVIKLKNPLFGAHNSQNILSAIAVGMYFNVDLTKIKSAIETYIPGDNRSQWVEAGGARIMLDAYNANPTSMRLAIESIASMPDKRKILILGSMKELGPDSKKEHQSLMEFLKSIGSWEKVVLVGEEYQEPVEPSWYLFKEVHSAGQWLRDKDINDSVLLIKGSRANALEKLLEVIQPSPSGQV